VTNQAFRRSGVQAFRGEKDRPAFDFVGPERLNARTPERLTPGFTLIELMIALTLLAVISGGVTMAFSTSLRAAASIQQRAEVTDERRKLVAQLQADLRGVWLRSGSQTTWFRGGDLSNDPNVAASTTSPGEAIPAQGDSLELTTTRPISLDALQLGAQSEGTLGPQSDVAQVSWRVERDTDGTLVLVRRERTPADPTIDQTQDPSVVRTVMSRSILGMQVYCFDGTQSQWLEEWDAALPLQDSSSAAGSLPSSSAAGGASSAAGLPQAVQVLLTFAPDSTGQRGVSRNQPSAQNLPLSVIVAMPGAEEQVLQEETQQTTGGSGG
jgi:prepilin-type N-terminal cleavage/methylation domain-containing protein